MNERYSRQILFPEIGREGQERLLGASVLIVGCGALGASHAEMLARAGVGKLRIVDRDFVEFTNLQRQTLYKESDAAERLPKAIAARNRIAEINSGVAVEAVVADVNNSNIESLIADCDVVIDGTDNFQVRYLVNDACVKHGTPWIYGAAVSSYGTTMTIRPGTTPCLRCVFPDMPDAGSAPTCDTAGVIMPIIASISAIQVAETIKLLVGDTDALHRSLIQIDLWTNDWRKIRLGCRSPQSCRSPHDSKGTDTNPSPHDSTSIDSDSASQSCRSPHDSKGTDTNPSPNDSTSTVDTERSDTAGFDADCPCCGKRTFEFLDAETQEFAAVLCGRDAVQIAPPRATQIDLAALAAKLAHLADVKHNDYLVRFTAEGREITVFADARAIIKNTDNPTTARNLYARYIGS